MVIRRTIALALAGVIGLSLSFLGATAASATLTQDERSTALWYTQRLKFDQIREQGLTGKGITIAVIDGGINPQAAELQGADIDVRGQFCRDRETGSEYPATTDDLSRSHGTSVVSMLVGNGTASDGGAGTQGIVPEARILFYAVDGEKDSSGAETCDGYNAVTKEFGRDEQFDVQAADYDVETDTPTSDASALAAKQALADGADIISISSVSHALSAVDWAPVAIMALRKGVPIVAGTLNPAAAIEDVLNIMPAALNGTVAVSGVDNDGKPITGIDPSLGDVVTQRGLNNMGFAGPAYELLGPEDKSSWTPGRVSGTSVATPLVAGTIALGLEKYPSATANQVLQSMVRTTGKGILHDPDWTSKLYGYGIINPVAMLAQDPTQYPDENPLFVRTSDDPRCGSGATTTPTDNLAQCAWASGPNAPRVWPAVTENSSQASDSGLSPLVLAGLITLGVGVVAAAVIVPVVVTRSRRPRTNSSIRSTASEVQQ